MSAWRRWWGGVVCSFIEHDAEFLDFGIVCKRCGEKIG